MDLRHQGRLQKTELFRCSNQYTARQRQAGAKQLQQFKHANCTLEERKHRSVHGEVKRVRDIQLYADVLTTR